MRGMISLTRYSQKAKFTEHPLVDYYNFVYYSSFVRLYRFSRRFSWYLPLQSCRGGRYSMYLEHNIIYIWNNNKKKIRRSW